MNELALFAGAGGGILGGILNGWRTVCAVEINDYCRRVLMQRQDDGILEPFPIWSDITEFDGRPWAGCVDIVTGGFPCQDISAAGKGAGITGERSGLWSEMARIIGEVQPRYVLVENSPMLTLRGLGTVLGDLASLGFDAEWGCISAAETGAPHKRERIWIVANASGKGARDYSGSSDSDRRGSAGRDESALRQTYGPDGADWLAATGATAADVADAANTICNERRGFIPAGENVPNERGIQSDGLSGVCKEEREILADSAANRRGLFSNETGNLFKTERSSAGNISNRSPIRNRWPIEPDVGRVAHGVAARVDRLKALGNGQVPRVVATAWETLT